jgi:RimJ/RimL family protein N-acetyltransferase
LPEVVLRTPRLALRRFGPADVELLTALDGDPEVMRFLTGGQPTPRAVIEDEVLPRYLAEYARYDRLGHWAVEAAGGVGFIGWLGLSPAGGDDLRQLELGWRLRRAAWGRGYATEGARALVRLAFDALGAQRVVAHTMTVNRASRRVMEKAGLRFVRTFFSYFPESIDGSEAGDVEYALDRADWERGRGALSAP